MPENPNLSADTGAPSNAWFDGCPASPDGRCRPVTVTFRCGDQIMCDYCGEPFDPELIDGPGGGE